MSDQQFDKNTRRFQPLTVERLDEIEKNGTHAIPFDERAATVIALCRLAKAGLRAAPSHEGTHTHVRGGERVSCESVGCTTPSSKAALNAVIADVIHRLEATRTFLAGEELYGFADDCRRMATDLSKLSATFINTLDTPERVCFYEQDHYYLSNFSAFRLRWAGRSFDTSEHAYHWEKFHGHDKHQEKILTANSAHEAFKYAERHKADRRPDWDAVKVEIMRDILRTKATQHEYVRRKLLQTGDRELVENSWRDPYWGWGPNRDGLNMLGKLWVEVRAELRVTSDGGAENV